MRKRWEELNSCSNERRAEMITISNMSIGNYMVVHGSNTGNMFTLLVRLPF